jgi:uncharacterized Zn finger protein (UPF0148 family)
MTTCPICQARVNNFNTKSHQNSQRHQNALYEMQSDSDSESDYTSDDEPPQRPPTRRGKPILESSDSDSGSESED